MLKTSSDSTHVYIRLIQYMEEHFSLEERYMEEINYPHMEAHVRAHNKFRHELNQILTPHTAFDEAIRHSVSLFLREWLMRHVMGIDKDLEQYILNSDIK